VVNDEHKGEALSRQRYDDYFFVSGSPITVNGVPKFMRSNICPSYSAVAGILLVLSFGSAYSADRKPVDTQADLPRFSYPVSGKVETLLDADQATFAAFAAPVEADIDSVLRDYDIRDHAALRDLLQAKLNLQIISGTADGKTLEQLHQLRALEDKPSARLIAHLDQEAFIKARMAAPQSSGASEACPEGFEAAYKGAVDPLPWETVGTDLKGLKGFMGVASHNFFEGFAVSNLQASVDQNHALDLPGAEALIRARAAIRVIVGCQAPLVAVLTAYVDQHNVTKPDIWLARTAVLPDASLLTPVNVAIWDSGIDTSLFPGRLLVDPKPGHDDPNGIAFDVTAKHTHGSLIPLTPEQQADYSSHLADMQGFSDLENDINSDAAAAAKKKLAAMSPEDVKHLFDEGDIFESYAHGTHVAGIAAEGNPAILLAYARITYDSGHPHSPPTDRLVMDLGKSYAEDVRWFKKHRIRVVNMSWWNWPAAYEKDLADNGIGKDAEDRKKLARHYFDIEKRALYAAMKDAPDILFVTIAGNSDHDNAFQEIIPSSFKLPNLIVTGAVDQAGDETTFTSYGENVLIDADGKAVESVVPGGTKVKMSGTSMAAPQVTNLAAKLLAIKPDLTPVQVIDLIRKGSDVSEDGRRHLMNPKRSVELLKSAPPIAATSE
jgi:hypothetical protein